MAGYMYFGSQRVCPAVLMGDSPEPEPTEYLTLKFPDDMKEITEDMNFSFDCSYTENGETKYFPHFIDFNNVEKITGYYYFYNGFRSVSRRNIAINLKNVKQLGDENGNATMAMAFSGGSFFNTNFLDGYTDISFDNLESINDYCFGYCFGETNITSIRFKKLTSMGEDALDGIAIGCSGVHIYFNAFNSNTDFSKKPLEDLCYDSTDFVIHFPSNMSTIIPTIDGYPDFGGTNTTILYDLEPTE